MKRDDLREVIVRAICRVQLNGGDPDQPAVRWNGTEIEPQSFPAWRDYMDEAEHALSALDAAGLVVAERKTIAEAHTVMRECGWQLAPGSDNVSGDGVLEVAAAEIEEKFRAMLGIKS